MSINLTPIVGLSLMLFSSIATAAPNAPPEEITAPKRATEAAVALARKGDMDQAFLYFQRAYSLDSKALETAANLGVAELALGRHREAATHLTLAIGRVPEDQDGRRDRLEARLQEAKAHIVTLRVEANTKRGVLFVDGEPVQPIRSTDPIYVDPGPHFVQLKGPDGDSPPQEVVGEAGQDLGLLLRVKSTTPPTQEDDGPTVTATVPAGDNSLTAWQTATIVGGSLTVVTGAIALGLFVRGAGLDGEIDDRLSNIATASGTPNSGCINPSSILAAECAVLRDDVNAHNNLVTPTNALGWTTLGLGVVTGGLLTYMLLFDEDPDLEQEADEQVSQAIAVWPTVGASHGAIMVGGRW